MMVDVDLGLNRPYTSPLEIREKLLAVMGEVGIGIRLATLPTITQVNMANCCL